MLIFLAFSYSVDKLFYSVVLLIFKKCNSILITMSEDLEFEIDRLESNASMRRDMLFDSAINREKVKKTLTIISGVLALFSATAITTILTKLVGSIAVQVLAALSAFASGIISL